MKVLKIVAITPLAALVVLASWIGSDQLEHRLTNRRAVRRRDPRRERSPEEISDLVTFN